MSSQLFKTRVELDTFIDFLTPICDVKEGKYIFNNESFKKANMFNKIEPFIEKIINYYYDSKKYFVTRKMCYMKFITVLRQLCNSLNLKYKNDIVYDKSSYEIIYCFYK